ncbi:flagellar hook-basal body complex protein FliE [Lyticum sinuosum]|uniref:Flagellar hook-basal body complex protein FliE n=1 Tax=Lyticum sinuosum TaxID=1332059 RepID=A0AAE5AI13_9RICK|nr:flagellar hook-basal body complex protein FliE [Lyticum sinuosum]MDZ5761464.1 Flagellar hook-basal body complex protein FliE [Lyticum sinuosum]
MNNNKLNPISSYIAAEKAYNLLSDKIDRSAKQIRELPDDFIDFNKDNIKDSSNDVDIIFSDNNLNNYELPILKGENFYPSNNNYNNDDNISTNNSSESSINTFKDLILNGINKIKKAEESGSKITGKGNILQLASDISEADIYLKQVTNIRNSLVKSWKELISAA